MDAHSLEHVLEFPCIIISLIGWWDSNQTKTAFLFQFQFQKKRK